MKIENTKCKSCKEFKRCVNFAGYPAKANDNICPYYVPTKKNFTRFAKDKVEIEMRDKLIEIIANGERKVLDHTFRGTRYYTEALADYLISNNVFVLPEQMKDSWELTSAFVLRLFCANEEEVAKMKQEFEYQKIKQILTDIRDYIVTEKGRVANSDIFLLQIREVEKFADKTLADLTEYAEKLGVEL